MAPKSGTGSTVFVLKGPDYSDGDASKKPNRGNCTQANPGSDAHQAYLHKIATKWMEEKAGGAEPGYTLWERPRPSNPKHTDRWLYGHPSGKFFDSPYRFYPHWKFLLNSGSGEACQCENCGSVKSSSAKSSSAKPSRRRSSTPLTQIMKAKGRPPLPRPMQSGPVDEEGTPDVIRSLFTLLKSEGRLKRKIEERASLDWRAEKPLVDTFAFSIPNQPAFLPRHGEIVLYLRPLQPYQMLLQDPKSHHFHIFNIATHTTEPPQWLAGIITQVPSTPQTLASINPSSTSTLSTSPSDSYRISPLPSPTSKQKHLSKQQTYTSLNLIRPFFLHAHILAGIPHSISHESIINALTLSTNLSLVDRHTFSGIWPDARIHSRGIFIGTEVFWIGDTVILLPSASPNPLRDTASAPASASSYPTEILRITDIVTTYHNLDPSAADPTSSKRITITLRGKCYTNDLTNSISGLPVPREG
ncbi:MAG: hypothetical protein L6R39_007084, partial [Caloplaca ligustica]